MALKRQEVQKYRTEEDERFYIGHFVTPKKKLTPKQKALREWHLHIESDKLFINIRLGGESGLRKAVMDGVQMYYYPDQNGELFVNIDWMIDRNVLGPSQTGKLKDLKEKVLKLKTPEGEPNGQTDSESRERCG